MGTKKSAAFKPPEPKYPGLVYPEESANNSLLNPDNYPLWEPPTDWKTPRTETVVLTPEVARLMYTRANPFNVIRNKKTWLSELRDRMNRRKWSWMSTIEFDWDGVMGDGHHRVGACAKSNAAIVVQVSYGHNPENYYKYDDNFKRDNATVVGLHRELKGAGAKRDAAAISAALTWTHRYWDDEVQSLESRTAIYKEDRLEQDRKYPKMQELLSNIRNIAKANKKKLVAPESILLALYALGCEVNESRTKAFIRNVIVGSNLDDIDPAWVYREFLNDAAKKVNSSSKGIKGRIYTSFKVEKGLTALRHYIDGNKITRLRAITKGIPRLCVEHEQLFEGIEREKAEKAVKKTLAAAAGA